MFYFMLNHLTAIVLKEKEHTNTERNSQAINQCVNCIAH